MKNIHFRKYCSEIEFEVDEDGDIIGEEGLYPVFLNIRDAVEVDAKGKDWDEIKRGEKDTNATSLYNLKDEVLEKVYQTYADEIGYDRSLDEDSVVDGVWEGWSQNDFIKHLEEYLAEQNAEFDDDGNVTSYPDALYFDKESGEFLGTTDGTYTARTRDIVEEANVGGKDGAIIRNVMDYGDSFLREDLRFMDKYPNEYVALDPSQIKSATDNIGTFDGSNEDIRYSIVSDNDELAKLNTEPTITVYRAMQLVEGKLYPPMAAKINGSFVEPTEIGVWYKADEHPELAIPVIDKKTGKQKIDSESGNPVFAFKLNKGNGSSIEAAYNPYWHTSYTPLNDQFSSAYKRPELVIVKAEVPASELTSGYKAEKAKDSVGEKAWHSGPVSSWLAEYGKKRRVILSRYNRVTEILPNSTVAAEIKILLEGTDISIPENVIPPELRKELEALDVDVSRKSRPAYSWEKLTKRREEKKACQNPFNPTRCIQ